MARVSVRVRVREGVGGRRSCCSRIRSERREGVLLEHKVVRVRVRVRVTHVV